MTDIVILAVYKGDQLSIRVLFIPETESKFLEEVERWLVGGIVGEAHTPDLVVVVLPRRACVRIRGEAVCEEPAARTIVGLEDLVGNIEPLEKHGSAQARNAGTDDGDASTRWGELTQPGVDG